MGRVIQPTAAPEFSKKINAVEGVTEAKLFAVAWTDSDGRRSMCLALQFGKDNTDGKPGVFILADAEDMKNQLRVANPTIKQGVRAFLAAHSGELGEVPSGVTGVDVGTMDAPPGVKELDIMEIEVGDDK
jgi:hypothetical protein